MHQVRKRPVHDRSEYERSVRVSDMKRRRLRSKRQGRELIIQVLSSSSVISKVTSEQVFHAEGALRHHTRLTNVPAPDEDSSQASRMRIELNRISNARVVT